MVYSIDLASFFKKKKELAELTKEEIKRAFDEMVKLKEEYRLMYAFDPEVLPSIQMVDCDLEEAEEYYTKVISKSVELFPDLYDEKDVKIYTENILLYIKVKHDYSHIEIVNSIDEIIALCGSCEEGSHRWIMMMKAKYHLLQICMRQSKYGDRLSSLIEELRPLRDVYEKSIDAMYKEVGES